MLKSFKFLIQPVLLEVDEEGNPIDEKVAEQPVVLYGAQAVRDFLDNLENDLSQQESE